MALKTSKIYKKSIANVHNLHIDACIIPTVGNYTNVVRGEYDYWDLYDINRERYSFDKCILGYFKENLYIHWRHSPRNDNSYIKVYV